jgi:hypothetical protein
MLYCIRQSRALPYELKTDSCLFRPQKRRKVELTTLRLCELHLLRDRHEPAERMIRLDERFSVTPNPSHEFAFPCASAEERDRMISDPGLPERKAERPETATVWRDLGEVEAEEAVLRGESLLLIGIAGTGKTFRAQGIAERLRCAGKRVDVISKTHTASRRAGGQTADHWVRRHILNGSASCDYLWVDEVSQVDIGLLSQIAKLHWEDVIQPSSSFACLRPLGPGLAEKCVAAYSARCSFCPLPQMCSVNSKCSEGCGTPQVQHCRVAMDNRNALRGKLFGKVV